MIRPLSASEKLLSGPPYMGCGLSADFLSQMLATDNESGMNQWQRQMQKGAKRQTLQRGWDAFENQVPPDSNGWVDQGDIELIRRAMWGKDCEQPWIGRQKLSDVWDAIGDYAVSAAIDTSAVPASNPIRRYVGPVPHQVVWWKKRTNNGTRQVFHYCPMHPPDKDYTGHWVKWADARKCATAIQGAQGEAFVILYPMGEWTQANLVRQRKNVIIRDQKATITEQARTITRVRGDRDDALETVGQLERELAQCGDTDALLDAVTEKVTEAIDGLRP